MTTTTESEKNVNRKTPESTSAAAAATATAAAAAACTGLAAAGGLKGREGGRASETSIFMGQLRRRGRDSHTTMYDRRAILQAW
jgi:hypothetical protein